MGRAPLAEADRPATASVTAAAAAAYVAMVTQIHRTAHLIMMQMAL